MRGKQTAKNYSDRLLQASRDRSLRSILVVLLVVVAFSLGMNVGNGRLVLPGKSVNSNNLPSSLDYTSVNQVYQSLKANYNGNLTAQQLTDGLKHGLATATKDPYTTYFTAAEAKSFRNDLNGTFSGIGAQLGKDAQGNIQVIAPIADTPADRAGIKAKDIVAAINGKSTAGLSIEDAIKAIRGSANTKVVLQVVRSGSDAPLSFTIMRQNITLPSVTTKTLENNVGYIEISSFADDTPKLITQAANKFKQARVRGLVLDMRNNPGGEVNSAVAVSSQWLPESTLIMQEKAGNKVLNRYTSTGPSTLGDIPTVVLVNSGSASASEITAAALHDNKHAYIIGEKSYGKGVVQQIISYKDGSQLKVTIASWYRPDGKNINHLGITPDQIVKLSDTDAAAGNDVQLQAAQTYLAAH